MARKHSISTLLGKNTQKKRFEVRAKVICNCINCNGLFIDPRTKTAHENNPTKKRKVSTSIEKKPMFSAFQLRSRKPALNHEISLDFGRHNSTIDDNDISEVDEESDFVEFRNYSASRFEDHLTSTNQFEATNDQFEDYSVPDFELSDFNFTYTNN